MVPLLDGGTVPSSRGIVRPVVPFFSLPTEESRFLIFRDALLSNPSLLDDDDLLSLPPQLFLEPPLSSSSSAPPASPASSSFPVPPRLRCRCSRTISSSRSYSSLYPPRDDDDDVPPP